MSTAPDRRSRKRLATRQAISDAATRLFIERGFDQVTVDDIAEAADVGRMTVFNHFQRKEDMFFDRDAEGRELLLAALAGKAPEQSPLEALRQLAQQLVREQHPALAFSERSSSFVAAVGASEALKARARAIRDELEAALAQALARSAGRAAPDADAEFAAGLLLASWSCAYLQAHQQYRHSADAAQAQAWFLARAEQGCAAVRAALAGTPYV
ncbi:TetR/AcrR family transcriptional regulator [Duganella qianjiadongensis]|uniref:TetR family transcriptional regulator n=1 Tax=Duganella qianjiadongensis TaxID=2692176 RepID=A0ABW9VKG4_9BURK|nr:TetR/AcrR family transcriptional regulator [Duganella qianjiadongensis]MYM40116.1 TetR family transcriptional regulator [Duganella qianjiadongensis]